MNKDEFLAKYNDVLSSYNDLAACVRRQLNYNYPYKPCLDDKNEIFCEDVIDVYTYHHEQLQPWPYGELVRADVSPCRYDKYPYGKPQTDEVARGSGNREYGCRRLREKLPNFSGVSFLEPGIPVIE